MTNQTVAYQCLCCGAGLSFDPEKQKFACEFCLSEFTEAELTEAGAAAAAQQQAAADAAYCEQMNLFSCPNCGAEMVADDTTAADFCVFCHNPVVIAGRLTGQMKPDRIIPFRIDKAEAEKIFLGWCRKKWFLPKSFSSAEHAAQIRGVYFPFWVTDADTDSALRAHATRVRSWRSGDYRYTETSHFDVRREGAIHFEDLVTCALSDADKEMLEGILPYPSDQLAEFSMPYLSGFLAKKRNVERSAVVPEVRGRMKTYAETLLAGAIRGPYHAVNVTDTQIKVNRSQWEYALLPVWMLTWTDKKGKVYTFALNGSTGKIYGELPVSFAKLAILAGAVAVPLTALFSLIGGVLC